MTAATASLVVVALFGLLIGVIVQVMGQISPKAQAASEPEPAGGGLRGFIKDVQDAADASRAQVRTMPRSQQLVVLTFYGLIGMLALVIKLSPVTMNWWAFLGSVFGGFLLAQFVFWLARTNRIRAN